MKPFDLEKALAGEKIVMRDGKEVIKVIKTELTNRAQNLWALFLDENGVPSISSHNEDGAYEFNNMESCNDLFMAPKVKTYYIDLYTDGSSMHLNTSLAYSDSGSQNIVEKTKYPNYLKTISFEIEE